MMTAFGLGAGRGCDSVDSLRELEDLSDALLLE